MKIYTRTGDAGETSLFGGARIRKDDSRIEAYGTVDELNSVIGVARAAWLSSPADAQLHAIQSDLFDIGAHLASPGSSRFAGPDAARIAAPEQSIDAMESDLAPLKTFILPGGSIAAAHLHVARTVCRRAERDVVTLARTEPVNQQVIVYLNRLSDLLFVLARVYNSNGRDDVLWQPGKTQTSTG